jgi:hypothetical protein
MRQGVFSMNSVETQTVIHVAAAALAVLILRYDLALLVRRPVASVDGSIPGEWGLWRSLLGLALGPLLLLAPLAYLMLNAQALPDKGALAGMVSGAFAPLMIKAILLAVCVELFFREAALKAFGENVAVLFIASALATFVFYLPGGFPSALVAAGAGVYYMTLRLIGAHILAVALVHALIAGGLAVFAPFVAETWNSAIYFTVAAAALSLTVYSLSAPKRIELCHA